MPLRVWKKLKELAKDDEMTLTGYINQILRQFLKSKER